MKETTANKPKMINTLSERSCKAIRSAALFLMVNALCAAAEMMPPGFCHSWVHHLYDTGRRAGQGVC